MRRDRRPLHLPANVRRRQDDTTRRIATHTAGLSGPNCSNIHRHGQTAQFKGPLALRPESCIGPISSCANVAPASKSAVLML